MIKKSQLKRYIDAAVKREIKKYQDDTRENLIKKLDMIMRVASQTFWERHLYGEKTNGLGSKGLSDACDRVIPSIKNGNFDRAKRIVVALYKNSDDYPKLKTKFETALNYINAIERTR